MLCGKRFACHNSDKEKDRPHGRSFVCGSGSDDERLLRAGGGAGAAADAEIFVERPGLGGAVHGQGPGGAFLRADRAVDALGGVLNGLAVVAGFELRGGRLGLAGLDILLLRLRGRGLFDRGRGLGRGGFLTGGFLMKLPETIRSSSLVAIMW